MTTTSLITVNAVLAAIVVLAVLRLLVHGIVTDRDAHASVPAARPLGAGEREELAA